MTTPAMTKAEAVLDPHHSGHRKVAVVAGGGRLPVNVARSIAAAGEKPFVVIVDGEVDSDSGLEAYDHKVLSLEQIALLIPTLKQQSVTHAVLAGSIDRRPDWRKLRPNLALISILPRLIAGLTRGDDGLLRTLIRGIEDAGIKVVGAHEIVPSMLADEGLMTKARPLAADSRDIESALAAAKAIGALDIGQAAVAIGGRAIALEGIEGTDGLLERVADLRSHGRIAGKGRGVLVKCAKPQQELRADLPTIGPATVIAAHKAGLAGIAVEAEYSFILDYPEVMSRADECGIFILGLARREDS
jgi:DUF1009 family protein